MINHSSKVQENIFKYSKSSCHCTKKEGPTAAVSSDAEALKFLALPLAP
jgi:hypothetical protein